MPVSGLSPHNESAAVTTGASDRCRIALHPKHREFARWYDRYMVLVQIMACVVVYLQASLILSNKSSENISLAAFILLLIVCLSWMAYGMLWTDMTVSLTGMTATIGAVIALVAIVSYRPTNTPGAFSTM